MSSKGVLVSPVLVATDIINCLDRKDTPEHTDGRQGFIWVRAMQANARPANITLAIRDFDKEPYEARKRFVQSVLDFPEPATPKPKLPALLRMLTVTSPTPWVKTKLRWPWCSRVWNGLGSRPVPWL